MSPSLDSAQTGPGPPGVGARAGPRSVGRTAPYRDTLEANVQLEVNQEQNGYEGYLTEANMKIEQNKQMLIRNFMVPISMFA